MKRFVRFLVEQGVGKPPLPRTATEIARAELRRDYEVYLRRQRGLSERTIFHSWRFADRFLDFRFGEEIGELSQIAAADIISFLQLMLRASPQTAIRRGFASSRTTRSTSPMKATATKLGPVDGFSRV